MSNAYSDRGKRRFGILEERIEYQFSDYYNLERALTHSSVRKNSDDNFHYERLEFLGDRVLGICIAELLFKEFPNAVEGELSLRLNALVNGRTLAQISDRLQLHEFIRTGGDLKQITGKRMRSVRADVLEALLASIYLDGGLKAAEDFISRFWADRVHDVSTARRDSKTALQEWAHAAGFGTPRYVETARTGPDHDPEFTVCVKIGDSLEETGIGRSKRRAEQAAAAKFLVTQHVWQGQDYDAALEME